MAVLAGCASEGGAAAPPAAGSATELAPSQTTPHTAAAPGLPPPCTATALSLAFRPDPTRASAGGSIAIRNIGSVRCEVQLAGSLGLDPDIEPDVWLDAGDAALLELEPDVTSCAEPQATDRVELVLGGEPVGVGVGAISACAVMLVALYPDPE